MSKRPSLLSRVRNRLAEAARRRRFARTVEHIHGDGFSVPKGAVLAIVLVRDGQYYIDEFLRYYRGLGISHFAFIDNGSTDGTIERLKREQGCVIDRAVLPLAQYEDLIRGYPAKTYGQDRWCLYVDMDEQFDFEGRDAGGLTTLIRYLDGRGDTALMAQMLEMFPPDPLQDVRGLSFAKSLARFDRYDVSAIDSFEYHSRDIPFAALLADNKLTTDALKFKFGGVRGKVFGEACCLTKHPLIFNGSDVVPAPHPHVSQHVKVADFTAVIRHYKFAGDVAARDAASAVSGDLAHGEDTARRAVMQVQSALTLYSDDAQEWRGIEPLYADGFLIESEPYRAFLQAQKA